MEAQLNNVKVAMEMEIISIEKGMEMGKKLLLKKHSAILGLSVEVEDGDLDTILSRSCEKELKEAMDAGLIDIKINGKKATDVDIAIEEDTGAIVITNGDGETAEIIISGLKNYTI